MNVRSSAAGDEPKRIRSSELFGQLSEAEKERLIARVRCVQEWIRGYAAVLGKWWPPKARIAETTTFYSPLGNQIAVTARALLEVDERSLRIVVAHEMGHFTRRWRLPFVRSEFALLTEERIADRVAMELTGATFDEIADAAKALAAVEGGFEGLPLETYLEYRRLIAEMPD